MGEWKIKIKGHGPHHNGERGERFDAEKLGAALVGELLRQGHDVQSATFHLVGGETDDLLAQTVAAQKRQASEDARPPVAPEAEKPDEPTPADEERDEDPLVPPSEPAQPDGFGGEDAPPAPAAETLRDEANTATLGGPKPIAAVAKKKKSKR